MSKRQQLQRKTNKGKELADFASKMQSADVTKMLRKGGKKKFGLLGGIQNQLLNQLNTLAG